MIAFLQPYFREEWRVYAESVQLAPSRAGERSAGALLQDPDRLGDALARHRRHWSDADPRAVASAWAMRYLWALLPPVVAAASGACRPLPMAADAMRLELDDTGAPVRFLVADLGDAKDGDPASTAGSIGTHSADAPVHPPSDVWHRYGPLVWDHLRLLADALFLASRLPRKTVWGGAVRYLEAVLKAMETHGAAPHAAHDRQQLLHEPAWGPACQERDNPLCLPTRVSRGDGPVMTLHRECCLYHLLPTAQYCAACPLAPQHRAPPRRAPPRQSQSQATT
jgi:ferric iron reductase protein FhuF